MDLVGSERKSTRTRVTGMPRLVAAAAVVAHLGFLVFLLVGGFVAWWAPWVLPVHVVVAAWGVWIVVTRRPCPLTAIENWGRVRSGRPLLDERGFIPHYLEGHLYPDSWARGVEVVAGALVVLSWIGLALR